MTIKQWHRSNFFELCELYKKAKAQIETPEGKRAFIVLSVKLHAAKANVPKSLWRYAK